jgi:hypothetical protein
LRTLAESDEGAQTSDYLYLNLFFACRFGTLVSVGFLLEKDLEHDLARAYFSKSSLLHIAAENKSSSVLEHSVQLGLDINTVDQIG